MTHAAAAEPSPPLRHTSEQYFRLVSEQVLHGDDSVELLEGVIVARSRQNPHHASGVWRAQRALATAVGDRTVVRAQSPLIAGHHSVPEPDVAVVPGCAADYEHAHPTTALLVVEVADSSLLQDRLTKAAIYAAAEIPELWIVNLRDGWVEVARAPEPAGRRYTTAFVARRGERLGILALQAVSVLVDDLLPALER